MPKDCELEDYYKPVSGSSLRRGYGFTYKRDEVLDHRSVFRLPASGWTLTELEADYFPLPMPFLTRIASICGPMR